MLLQKATLGCSSDLFNLHMSLLFGNSLSMLDVALKCTKQKTISGFRHEIGRTQTLILWSYPAPAYTMLHEAH